MDFIGLDPNTLKWGASRGSKEKMTNFPIKGVGCQPPLDPPLILGATNIIHIVSATRVAKKILKKNTKNGYAGIFVFSFQFRCRLHL